MRQCQLDPPPTIIIRIERGTASGRRAFQQKEEAISSTGGVVDVEHYRRRRHHSRHGRIFALSNGEGMG